MVKEPQDLIFVDNGSGDGLNTWVNERFPTITVVSLTENRFFCGGYNAGIRVAMERGYDFVLMTNADTEVFNPQFLYELALVARRRPEAAFIGPQVFWKSPGIIQKTCLQYPSILKSCLIWIPWRLARKNLNQRLQKEREVEFLNGVCILCRVKAVKEIGMMDENFGGYVEDVDWAWRAREKGWTSVFSPVPSVIHHEETNGYEPYSLKTFLLKRNTVYWYLKIGRHQSAKNYALASLMLAWMRMKIEVSAEPRAKHQYFLKRLRRAYQGLLDREALGSWFGPPLDSWNV
jgi:GT2 family glycosyltransferase